MIKKMMIILAAFSMSACSIFGRDHIEPVKTEYRVVMPESKYFECEVVKLPPPETLTDVEIAKLINDLVKANRICKNNVEGLKTYLQAAQDVLEKK